MKRLFEQLEISEDWKSAVAAGLLGTSLVASPVSAATTSHIATHATSSKADVNILSPEMKRDLNSELVSKIEKLSGLAKQKGISFKIIKGYRSPEEQIKLYAQGRTTPGKIVTKVKHSKHTEGKAIDIAILKDGKISWEGSDYFEIGELGKSLGLIWGGDWKMRDYGHFEID